MLKHSLRSTVLLASVLLIILCVVTACGKNNNIVGTWDIDGEEVVFTSDNKFYSIGDESNAVEYQQNDKTIVIYEGDEKRIFEYELDGDVLKLVIQDDMGFSESFYATKVSNKYGEKTNSNDSKSGSDILEESGSEIEDQSAYPIPKSFHIEVYEDDEGNKVFPTIVLVDSVNDVEIDNLNQENFTLHINENAQDKFEGYQGRRGWITINDTTVFFIDIPDDSPVTEITVYHEDASIVAITGDIYDCYNYVHKALETLK